MSHSSQIYEILASWVYFSIARFLWRVIRPCKSVVWLSQSQEGCYPKEFLNHSRLYFALISSLLASFKRVSSCSSQLLHYQFCKRTERDLAYPVKEIGWLHRRKKILNFFAWQVRALRGLSHLSSHCYTKQALLDRLQLTGTFKETYLTEIEYYSRVYSPASFQPLL